MSQMWDETRAAVTRILAGDCWRELARCREIRDTMIYAGHPAETEAVRDRCRPVPDCPLGLADNMIHQAYHLVRFRAATGWWLPEDGRALELGAGYGAMQLCLRSWGFRGNYVAFDFPELLELQLRYAYAAGLPPFGAVTDVAGLPPRPDLAIALWSLTEMPPPLQDRLLAVLHPRAWLVAYCREFEGQDSTPWKLMADDRYQWINCGIAHQPDNYYLFGIEKGAEL